MINISTGGKSTKLNRFTGHSLTRGQYCARQHAQRQAVHYARVPRTGQRPHRYAQSEAGAMRRTSSRGAAQGLRLVQRRAHILKGVYEVNHLAYLRALSHTYARTQDMTGPQAAGRVASCFARVSKLRFQLGAPAPSAYIVTL